MFLFPMASTSTKTAGTSISGPISSGSQTTVLELGAEAYLKIVAKIVNQEHNVTDTNGSTTAGLSLHTGVTVK